MRLNSELVIANFLFCHFDLASWSCVFLLWTALSFSCLPYALVLLLELKSASLFSEDRADRCLVN